MGCEVSRLKARRLDHVQLKLRKESSAELSLGIYYRLSIYLSVLFSESALCPFSYNKSCLLHPSSKLHNPTDQQDKSGEAGGHSTTELKSCAVLWRAQTRVGPKIPSRYSITGLLCRKDFF